MASVNVRIKRRGSSSWDSLFPETTVDQIKNNSGSALSDFTTNILEASNPSADSFIKVTSGNDANNPGAITFRTASQTRSDIGAAEATHSHGQSEITNLATTLSGKADLDSNDKILSSQIPDYLFSGLKFAGTTAGGTDENGLDELLQDIDDAFNLGSSPSSAQRQGGYFIVTTQFTIAGATGHRILMYDDGTTDDATVEAGDWIVYIGYGDENGANSDAHEWAIINNTYRTATSGALGVVKLSDAASTTRSALSNTENAQLVMDEKAVRTVMKHIFYESSEGNSTGALQGDLLFEGTY